MRMRPSCRLFAPLNGSCRARFAGAGGAAGHVYQRRSRRLTTAGDAGPWFGAGDTVGCLNCPAECPIWDPLHLGSGPGISQIMASHPQPRPTADHTALKSSCLRMLYASLAPLPCCKGPGGPCVCWWQPCARPRLAKLTARTAPPAARTQRFRPDAPRCQPAVTYSNRDSRW
jgi:hypothetical protein